MATPVSLYSFRYQAQDTPEVEGKRVQNETAEDAEQAQGTPKIENREYANSTLQNEFDDLISRYYSALEKADGCGDRAQEPIDTAYERLYRFADGHPEFKAKLPQKCIIAGARDTHFC